MSQASRAEDARPAPLAPAHAAARPAPGQRADYRHFLVIPTRWNDNDLYGHLNNSRYYALFDTVIAGYAMTEADFDPWHDTVIGYAVENGCRFHQALRYPDTITAGLRIGHLGRSSVRYEIGLFKNDEPAAAAEGHFIHVFVNRSDERPAPLPDRLRTAFARILVDPA